MPSLVPGVRDFSKAGFNGVDGRDKPGHEGHEVTPRIA